MACLLFIRFKRFIRFAFPYRHNDQRKRKDMPTMWKCIYMQPGRLLVCEIASGNADGRKR